MSQSIIGVCKQSGCTVTTTGKCLEGFPTLDECPHFTPDIEADNYDEEQLEGEAPDPALTRTSINPPSEVVMMPFGDDLTSSTSKRIMGRAKTRVIVLAGDVDSGKTTLLTAIYEKFLDGPFAGYMFARSDTVPGLERRCHLSRIPSERMSPDTERTRGPMTLLHLRVRRIGNVDPSQDILFSDISGEDFEAARNSIDVCKQMTILKRADHCLLLLDGRKLASLELRQKAFRGGEMLLRSLLDSEMLGKQSLVDVLFTKYDLISSDINHQTEEFLSYIQQELLKKFANRLARIRFHRIAARPPQPGSVEPAYGLEGAFSSWVEETAQHQHPRAPLPTDLNTGREFDGYLERRLPDFISKEYS
jgi:hypothetical protein